jgi:hypothetical protein
LEQQIGHLETLLERMMKRMEETTVKIEEANVKLDNFISRKGWMQMKI